MCSLGMILLSKTTQYNVSLYGFWLLPNWLSITKAVPYDAFMTLALCWLIRERQHLYALSFRTSGNRDTWKRQLPLQSICKFGDTKLKYLVFSARGYWQLSFRLFLSCILWFYLVHARTQCERDLLICLTINTLCTNITWLQPKNSSNQRLSEVRDCQYT